MKVVLVDIAAKYIHTGLASRYLYQCCIPQFPQTVLLERTVNQPIDDIIAAIYREEPTIVGFSCYIWNIETTITITQTLKKILPNLTIVLGGPEVSFTAEQILKHHPYIDYVISGEGEIAFPTLLKAISESDNVSTIAGLCYRYNGSIYFNTPKAYCDLNHVPNAYQNASKQELKNRIVYYECSRGCPYRCAYCLSGLAGKVRFLPIERIKRELHYLAVELEVPQIKFVDRTFNHNKAFAIEVFDFLKNLNTTTNFHFEIRADLLDDEILDILQDVSPGRFQFEIGVQSTHKPTLKAIARPHNWDKLSNNVRKVKAFGNIHQHLDLIAGLPFEDYRTFTKSFNDVYALEPDMLQLGFLKLIKGSTLEQSSIDYKYQARTYPPYEVLSNEHLSYQELLQLKDIEAVLELYYNSGHFKHTLNNIVCHTEGFQFYNRLSKWFRTHKLFEIRHSLEKLFDILYQFLKDNHIGSSDINRELLKLDFLCHYRHRQLPKWMNHMEIPNQKQRTFEILNKDSIRNLLHPKLRDKPVREILKQTHIEQFNSSIAHLLNDSQPLLLLFDYSDQKSNWVNKKAKYYNISNLIE